MEFLDDRKKKLLNDFAKFAIKELKIKTPPTIAIQNGRGKLKTTAAYDYTKDDKVLKVNCKNRLIVDVLRSMAHELNHHKQWEDGRLKEKPPDIGGPIEDESNAKAGQLIKMFAKIDNTIYDE